MDTPDKLLAILQIAVPADTPLTVASEVQILELLGIVKSPELVKAMKLATTLVPDSSPATLKGFLALYQQLMRHSPKAGPEHHHQMESILSGLAAVPDEPLTFGNFLAICQALMSSETSTSKR
jgi:hypothetical protein